MRALLSAAVDDALARAGVALDALDGIAVTSGPGLIGSLVVGVAAAKALAFATGLPLYAVNHLHGHLFAAFLERDEPPPYPFLALLVSGGHTQLVEVKSPTALRVIGKTRDDAAGEAFDKTARLLGLGFPGGPALEALARDGDPQAFAFPRHRPDPGTLDMSFSGLKTSVRYFLESDAGKDARREDVAASFQAAVIDVLIDRVSRALDDGDYRALVLSGGVAANTALQAAFRALGEQRGIAGLRPRTALLHRQRRDDRRRRRAPRGRRARRPAHARCGPEPAVRRGRGTMIFRVITGLFAIGFFAAVRGLRRRSRRAAAERAPMMTVRNEYSGLENRVYRIEIERGGSADGATFSWSRDDDRTGARQHVAVQAGTWVPLEDGLDVRFDGGAALSAGDFWTFPARSAADTRTLKARRRGAPTARGRAKRRR